MFSILQHAMFIFPVAPSVSNAVAMLDTPDEYREMHSVTVTCIIHPESEAEFCEVMLITSGNLTKIGNHTTHLIMYSTHTYNVYLYRLYVYVCMCISNSIWYNYFLGLLYIE